jgi:thymidylate kinase
MQLRVRERFRTLQQMDETTMMIPWKIIDATKSMDEMEEDIWDIVQTTMDAMKYQPINKLWES